MKAMKRHTRMLGYTVKGVANKSLEYGVKAHGESPAHPV